ncbi:hypothetical protein BJ912DRAFT_367017 [Pholiota molesta]|nr:hypothetical protein BJ912DRAFT_367017 [Pholiota molesta]
MAVGTSEHIAAAAIAITASNFIYSVASGTPITSYQYTKAGGKRLDEAIEILHGPRGKNLEDEIRESYLQTSDILISTREELEEQSESYIGSIVNWKAAKTFYTRADKFHGQTLMTSNKATIHRDMQDIVEKRRETELREAEERERQIRRLQIQGAIPRPSHANAYPQYSVSQTPMSSRHVPRQPSEVPNDVPAHLRYSSSQELTYPPVAYQRPAANDTSNNGPAPYSN